MSDNEYYNPDEFIKRLHSLAMDITEELQREGIPAVLTSKVGRNILLRKYRIHHIVNITIGKNDKLTVINTRRLMTKNKMKHVGEIYLGKQILYRDEWLYMDDKYQILFRTNYMTLSNGEPLPKIKPDFQLHPLVINPYQLLYEAFNELTNSPQLTKEIEQDIVDIIKLIAKFQ